MSILRLPRLTGWRPIATILIVTGVIAAVARFTLGLGATTNLTDEFPWGLWIGFDFLGIGLAASGNLNPGAGIGCGRPSSPPSSGTSWWSWC